MPASILDKSRISLISCNNKVLLLSMMLTYSCFSSSSWVEANMPEKPTMALRGVRISWLIFARKADFRRFDSSARFLAFTSSCSIFFRSVMTSEEPTKVSGSPLSFRVSTAGLLPSLFCEVPCEHSLCGILLLPCSNVLLSSLCKPVLPVYGLL